MLVAAARWMPCPASAEKPASACSHPLPVHGHEWGRFRLGDALAEAEQLCDAVRQRPETIRVEIAGSVRRYRETVRDIDLVASSEHPTDLAQAFATMPMVSQILLQGPTKTTVRLTSGLQADLRVVSDEEYPLLLHHLTGSKDHNRTDALTGADHGTAFERIQPGQGG